MLTPIEDLGFSHDLEQGDGEWDGLETVHAKFTAQWYVDPNGLAWNFQKPGYVLREREVFVDGVCSVIAEGDGDERLIRLYGPGYNFEGDWPPGDFFLYVNKHVTDGKAWYDISWNANFEGEAAYNSAQWNLGEDFQFDGKEDLSSFTLSNDLVKLEVKPIPSFSKPPYVHPLIIKDFVGWVSDRGVIIQSVDLLNAQNSNRYSGDIETREESETLWVSSHEYGERISYALQAELRDGKYILNVIDGSSGTYVGKHALLVQFSEEKISGEKRIVLKYLGETN
ncbi:hypothetical protein N9B49_01055 [bacterium]|nr:hypothetical protein [bacterium]